MAKKFLYLLALFVLTSRIAFALNTSLIGTSAPFVSPPITKLDTENSTPLYESTLNPNEPFIFAALPAFDEQIKTSIKTADARPEIIRQYLQKFKSPLEPHADLIVTLSDQYKFDYRWLVAIAQQESNLCKHIPENSFNCWGWGIYPDPKNPEVLKVTRFDNYEDALRRIAPQFTKIFLKGAHSRWFLGLRGLPIFRPPRITPLRLPQTVDSYIFWYKIQTI
ncbi:MAG: hypothetical protein UW68_C0017G0017 [Candidatus Collierbacteria bacterium GW2011_GWB1_44_6]|uniref:Uncharacterized protein n=1 Tax=Candidatus Collierbacteria bacterium GW2011_GWB1_44_6 TaxID=1618384 RepID=A0A0G1LW85_9BACT|nr:MAG: hypothetical protein UW68_C0017G0017 [Candidatus Collierbacteria bacterium GW2011_GWB1_44_6]